MRQRTGDEVTEDTATKIATPADDDALDPANDPDTGHPAHQNAGAEADDAGPEADLEAEQPPDAADRPDAGDPGAGIAGRDAEDDLDAEATDTEATDAEDGPDGEDALDAEDESDVTSEFTRPVALSIDRAPAPADTAEAGDSDDDVGTAEPGDTDDADDAERADDDAMGGDDDAMGGDDDAMGGDDDVDDADVTQVLQLPVQPTPSRVAKDATEDAGTARDTASADAPADAPSDDDGDGDGDDTAHSDDELAVVPAGEPVDQDVTQVIPLPLPASRPRPVARAVQAPPAPEEPLRLDDRAKAAPGRTDAPDDPDDSDESDDPDTTPAVAQAAPGTPPKLSAATASGAVPSGVAVAEAVEAGDRAEPRVSRLAASVASWLPPLLTLEGLVMYVLALRVPHGAMRGVDLDRINGLGLISVLPVTAFAAIALIIVSFFVTLTQNTDRKGLLLFQLAAVTFTLHGAAALVEAEPRFPTAWVHAGFAEYIGRAGEALPGLDARFAWPGFFALFGFVLRAAGVEDPSTVLQWTPLVSNLLYLLPFVLILRQIVATTRARWFAALLFILVQWIGQDYFSPQGFTFALYLVFVAVLMRWFGRAEPRTAPLPSKGLLRRTLARLDRLTPGELPARPTTVTDRVVLLTLLVGLFFATTATHQITPFMMMGALTGLILLRRSALSLALPVFFGLIVIAWINYQATPFWSGRIDELFGGIGKIFANLQENTGDRLVGTDAQHGIVLKVRLGICGVILLFAAVGLLRRLRRGVGDRAAAVLLCVPTLALGLQSYGGEIGLRVYMFALPAACILGAYAFFPNLPAHTTDAREGETVPIRRRTMRYAPGTTRRVSAVLAAVTALALAGAFLVARYGNEKFERVTTGEAAAMHYVYAHDRPSARLLYLVPILGEEVTPTIPWRERDIDRVEYDQALVTKDPADLAGVLTALRGKAPNTFLITTRGQAAYLELNEGFPPEWGERFRAALDASTKLKRVYANQDAAIYTLRTYPKGSEIPPPAPVTMVGDRSTPWTPFGLVALALAVSTLFAAELARLRGTERAARGRRKLVIIGLLMTAAALAVIVERFLTLTSG
ncbi:hypothetical protein ABZT47_14550 [Sphaerisporangium sp. NPDC005289]|uniref:hypothetical protein n=1 Tax=Sphaerisporangium sp. NPDC005289 TaxID=3155247 RepID=UPI0033B3AA94